MSLSPPRRRSGDDLVGSRLRVYWCYQCNRSVRLMPRTGDGSMVCPYCSGQFLVEIETRRSRLFVDFTAGDPYPDGRLLEALSLVLEPPVRRVPLYRAEEELPARRRRQRRGSIDDLDRDNQPGIQSRPVTWIILRPIGPSSLSEQPRRRRRRLRGDSIDNPGRHPGDYFSGQELRDLIEQITQNDRPGAAPAPVEAISSIPSIRITENHLNSDSSQCSVCKEEFTVNAEVKQLPCHHIYHKECIVPWLTIHNSCPICRKELQVGETRDEKEAAGEVNCGRRCRWCRRLMENLVSLRPFRRRQNESLRSDTPPSSSQRY